MTPTATTATYNLGEVASILDLHRSTIREWLTRGRLKGERDGRDWKISQAEVDRVQAELDSKLLAATIEAQAGQLFGQYVRLQSQSTKAKLIETMTTCVSAGVEGFTSGHVDAVRAALVESDRIRALVDAAVQPMADRINQTLEDLEELRNPSSGWVGDLEPGDNPGRDRAQREIDEAMAAAGTDIAARAPKDS